MKQAAKIERAKSLAQRLPPMDAAIVTGLLQSLATSKDNNSRLWHDNAALRRDMATISRTTVLSEAQRIAQRHIAAQEGAP